MNEGETLSGNFFFKVFDVVIREENLEDQIDP